MFGSSLNIIAQAIEVYKKAIDVRNRNIANAQEENYVAEEPIIQSDLYSGITLQEVRRLQNFNFISLRNEKLSYVNYLEERRSILENVESVFQEFSQGAGLSDYVDKFFEAYQDLMKEPTNEGAKEQLISSAESLVNTIKSRYADLNRIKQSIDYSLERYVDKVNDLIKKIYSLNKEITFQYAQTQGKEYKTLLDQRDEYLKELASYINIRAQEDELGRVKVYTSKGFLLVDFTDNYFTLDYKGGKVIYKRDGSDLTNIVESGKIKGLLEASRDIDSSIDDLRSLIDTFARKNGENYVEVDANGNPIINFIAIEVRNGTTITLKEIFNVNLDAQGKIDISSLKLNITETDLDNLSYETIQDSNAINPSNPNYAVLQVFDSFPKAGLYVWENTEKAVNDLVNRIAVTKNGLDSEYDVEKSLYDSLERKILERQGVSIDQEFMEIINIQRTYEALAKILPRIDELMQTTLNMI
ncbi:MAG TPA: flagellar hook-associated protein FlgK [Aquifex aeolicus]|nr:flagellar hook-associated protein FlgK [Aquifex aeolicus]